jgi:exopolysaccharide biosynthesis WecB/TagA/CpsF family protein
MISWPTKHDVLGVQVAATTYEETVDLVVQAVREGIAAIVSLHAVHAVVTASGDPGLREKVNAFQVVAPDGQPVRWALNWLYGARLRERVYGPELTLRLCQRASQERIPVYFYGSSAEVVERLRANLTARYPGLQIAGAESPPFRALTPEEDQQMVERINQSGAGIVFVGLGCPKQDHFAHDHRERIRAVQACVGAAFDFHAGTKKMAPRWMQRRGLEWLYRLCQEPGRLWRRYTLTNGVFVAKLLVALLRQRLRSSPVKQSAREGGSDCQPVQRNSHFPTST